MSQDASNTADAAILVLDLLENCYPDMLPERKLNALGIAMGHLVAQIAPDGQLFQLCVRRACASTVRQAANSMSGPTPDDWGLLTAL